MLKLHRSVAEAHLGGGAALGDVDEEGHPAALAQRPEQPPRRGLRGVNSSICLTVRDHASSAVIHGVPTGAITVVTGWPAASAMLAAMSQLPKWARTRMPPRPASRVLCRFSTPWM